jgi:hypothetical protein
MGGWHSERQDWKFDGRVHWWIPLLVIGGFIMLVSHFGGWLLWLPVLFFILPAMFGRMGHHRGWQHRGQMHGWGREWRGWGMCGGDGEPMKRKHGFDGEKPKHRGMYIYREDGEVLEVRDAPEKPKRTAPDGSEYV